MTDHATAHRSTSVSAERGRRPGRWAMAAALGALLVASVAGTSTTALAQAADDGLDQQIRADQAMDGSPATLTTGHVDLGPRFVDGDWALLVHDDTALPPVWRPLDAVVIQVTDAALVPVPDDDRYAFLDLDPGTEVHVIPQTQNPDVVWLGWNTQAPDVVDRVARGVTMRLIGVDGPGDLTVFLQAGTMEPPDVLWRSSDGPDPLFVELGTHTHANWLFSAPGIYLAHLEVSAELIDGSTVTETATVRFAVGDGADVEAARQAAAAPPTSTGSPEVAATAATDDDAAAEDDGAFGGTVAVLAGVVVLLAAAVGVVAWRSARTRERAADRQP